MDDLLSCGIEVQTSHSTNDGADANECSTSAAEIASYMQLKPVSKITDSLKWWSTKTQQFPLLKQLASKYLCIPATSASSERSFSSARLTASNLRTQLTGEHLEALKVLHCNKALLKNQFLK